MNTDQTHGTPISEREAKEIDSMFRSLDNLHREGVKRGTTASKVYSRTTGSERAGRLHKRPVLLSHKERQRQKR